MTNIVRSLLELNIPGTTTVYHVTRKKNLSSIKRSGLTPRIGSNSKKLNEDEGIHFFYKWNEMEDAIMNWDHMDWWDDDEEELVVLTLKVPQNWLTDDPDYPRSIAVCKQTIPARMIKKVTEI